MSVSIVDYLKKVRSFLFNNIVTIIFIVFVAFGFYASEGMSVSTFLSDIMTRFFRNGLLVISLIIPVMAGLGLNFGIVVGALAGILAILPIRYIAQNPAVGLELGGIGGLMLCFLLAIPLAMFFGYLTGKLYNRTRGQELIASLIVGYFAEGLYLILVLIVIGTLIPVAAGHPMIIPFTNVGVRTSFDMGPHASLIKNPETEQAGLKYALDYLWRVEFLYALLALGVCVLAFLIFRRIRANRNPAIEKSSKWVFAINCAVWALVILLSLHGILLPGGLVFHFGGGGSFTIPASPLLGVGQIPAVTGLVIAAFCLFTMFFTKTKLGQDCRSVGQSQHIAKVAGINVDRTRIIATMFSTVFASWGMIIFLQNMGTVSTYTSHRQIGFNSVAALLVGGATAAKASVKNAMLGILLFHAMFIVSPSIGRYFSGDEGVGEYTRSFMVYGVIALALGLYIWKDKKAARDKESLEAAAEAGQKTLQMTSHASSKPEAPQGPDTSE